MHVLCGPLNSLLCSFYTHAHARTCTRTRTCTCTHIHTQSGASVLPTLTTPHRHHHHHHTPHGKLRQLPPQATVEDVVTEIFRVFVDAIPHVPDHRRLPLLFHLLGRVGPSQYLSVALGLLVSKHVQQLGVKEQVSVAGLKNRLILYM